MSKSLPLPASVETESAIPAVKGNGMNAAFDQTVHCIAAEPDATLFRVSVSDGSGQEVAYETAVLGRLRRGYRILQLRSPLGTRIELCYLFVKISFGSEPNEWANPRQVRNEVVKLKQQLAVLRASHLFLGEPETDPQYSPGDPVLEGSRPSRGARKSKMETGHLLARFGQRSDMC